MDLLISGRKLAGTTTAIIISIYQRHVKERPSLGSPMTAEPKKQNRTVPLEELKSGSLISQSLSCGILASLENNKHKLWRKGQKDKTTQDNLSKPYNLLFLCKIVQN